jgi:hypothetical protein
MLYSTESIQQLLIPLPLPKENTFLGRTTGAAIIRKDLMLNVTTNNSFHFSLNS